MSKLYKNKQKGMVFGVCAGLSESLGVDVRLIRVLTILFSIATGSIVFWIYIALGILLPSKD